MISAAYGWFVTHDVQFSVFFLASAVCTSLIGTMAEKKTEFTGYACRFKSSC